MTMRHSIAAAQQGAPTLGDNGAHLLEFQFAAADPTFVGHFPGKPMVPGVFQIEMACFGAELVLGQPLALREVGKAKFLRPILPEQRVSLTLRASAAGDGMEVRAEFSVNGARAGEMLLFFRFRP